MILCALVECIIICCLKRNKWWQFWVSCCLCTQNQELTSKLNATLLVELNTLRRYFATNSPVPDTLDVIASRILRVLDATATVDRQAQGIEFTTLNQRGLLAQQISYYRLCFFVTRELCTLYRYNYVFCRRCLSNNFTKKDRKRFRKGRGWRRTIYVYNTNIFVWGIFSE